MMLTIDPRMVIIFEHVVQSMSTKFIFKTEEPKMMNDHC